MKAVDGIVKDVTIQFSSDSRVKWDAMNGRAVATSVTSVDAMK